MHAVFSLQTIPVPTKAAPLLPLFYSFPVLITTFNIILVAKAATNLFHVFSGFPSLLVQEWIIHSVINAYVVGDYHYLLKTGKN